jgi:hypothetical protein
VWFLDSVCDTAFGHDPEVENKKTAGLNTIDDDVAFYQREYPKRIQRLRSTPGDILRRKSIFSARRRGLQSGFSGWPTTTASIPAAN